MVAIDAPRPRNPLRTILTAGIVAGALDGLDAVLFIAMVNGIPVRRLFQFIASGLLGAAAFRGGAATALVGVAVHFSIAITVAAVFYVLALKFPMLLQRPILWGVLYGFAVFVIMHYLVVPLTAAPKQPPASFGALANLVVSHTLFVGIPIAYITRRGAKREAS